ncbi:MAG: glutamate racemase [Bacteroidetes bacterium]|nr:glutamate racemase [Bacteroidota bacterium]
MPRPAHPSSRPLGIFDSGIGGLTVANAIHELMPNETLIYFGDTAHLPYGDKSPEAIRKWSVVISDFLLSFNCKAIVIACNSISSVAYDTVKKHVGNKAIVINVIDPVVDYVSAQAGTKNVGVIGTKATIKSDVYAAKLKARSKKIGVSSLATPLLAPMIEEGFFNNKISKTIINDYLSRPKLKNIDSLILGCTHYPLIRPEIEQYYKGRVQIFDSARIVAHHVQWVLDEQQLLHQGKAGKHRFFISDFTSSFEMSTKIFFKGKVKLEQKNLWK